MATHGWDAASNLVTESVSDDLATNLAGDGRSIARTVNAVNQVVRTHDTADNQNSAKDDVITTWSRDGMGRSREPAHVPGALLQVPAIDVLPSMEHLPVYSTVSPRREATHPLQVPFVMVPLNSQSAGATQG